MGYPQINTIKGYPLIKTIEDISPAMFTLINALLNYKKDSEDIKEQNRFNKLSKEKRIIDPTQRAINGWFNDKQIVRKTIKGTIKLCTDSKSIIKNQGKIKRIVQLPKSKFPLIDFGIIEQKKCLYHDDKNRKVSLNRVIRLNPKSFCLLFQIYHKRDMLFYFTQSDYYRDNRARYKRFISDGLMEDFKSQFNKALFCLEQLEEDFNMKIPKKGLDILEIYHARMEKRKKTSYYNLLLKIMKQGEKAGIKPDYNALSEIKKLESEEKNQV